jgi:DNA-binding NarL/FixJ family response regulator
MAKLIVADDHPLFRNALIHAISNTFVTKATIETDCFEATCEALLEHPDADLLLLDLHMPGNCGFLGLIQLRKQYPTLPIVVISASDDVDVIKRVMAFGASAFIPKSAHPAEIGKALSAVIDGELWVPPAIRSQVMNQQQHQPDLEQYKVLFYLTEGWLNKQIAYDLHISEATVKAHITAIFRKLGVTNRTQVVIQAQRLQLEAPADKTLVAH